MEIKAKCSCGHTNWFEVEQYELDNDDSRTCEKCGVQKRLSNYEVK